MNPLEKKPTNNDASGIPNNLPHNGSDNIDENIKIKISKKSVRTTAKAIIIILILIMAAPRIINNISSTLNLVQGEVQKFPTIFPGVTAISSTSGNFIYNKSKDISETIFDNLASMAKILYNKKLDKPTSEIIGTKEIEETEKPIRIIIDKVGIDSVILNPTNTNIEILDEALNYGVVRYPKSGILGEDNNIYLFGHSTGIEVVRNQSYKSLNGLKNIVSGDVIRIQSEEQEHLYRATSITLKKDSDALIEFKNGKRKLTISTCDALGKKEDRYIVEADFIASYPLSTDTPIITPTTPNQTEETPSSQTPTQGERIINTYPIENAIKVSDPSGKADLSAEITEIGILDSVTNEFIATTTLRSSDKIAFKFIISNLGTKKAEGWSFNAVLPTKPFHIFHSNTQATLMTGERIEYAMGFDKAKEGDNEVIIVNVDPNRSIYELNESNNIIKKFIKIIN